MKQETHTTAMDVIDVLATEIGTRFGGTKGEHEAADYLESILDEIGLDTSRQAFSYTGWELVEEPSLRFVSPIEEELDVEPLLWSGTTDGPIRGEVEPAGEKSLIPGLDGYELPMYSFAGAEVLVSLEDHAIPLINPRPLYQTPQFIVSKDAGSRIESFLDQGETVELEGSVEAERGPTTSYNVIGEYRPDDPVNPGETVVVGAHYDTTIDTPGAYDNASGVGAVVETAIEVIERDLPLNVDFVMFACEENGILGSQEYVTRLRERSELDKIDRAIVLDMMSGGETFSVWADESHEFADTIVDASLDAGIDESVIELSPQIPGSDGWPLHDAGIPTTTLLWWKLNELYHTSADTVEHVDREKLQQSIDTTLSILQQQV